MAIKYSVVTSCWKCIVTSFCCIAAQFGKGVYFALNAWYSAQDKYSTKNKNGHKHILVCTLLVGKYTKGHRTMKIAPSVNDNPQVRQKICAGKLMKQALGIGHEVCGFI